MIKGPRRGFAPGLALAVLSVCAVACDAASGSGALPSKYVNPFIGTLGNAHCFPNACVPFGLVQAGPVTGTGGWRYSSGYQFDDAKIYGFVQDALNGTGVGDLGDLLVQPLLGESGEDSFGFPCAKSEEKASAGYYSVGYAASGVTTEITAAPHAALYRISGRKGLKLLVDQQWGLGRKSRFVNHVLASETEFPDAFTMIGHNHNEMWVDRHWYFAMKFNREVTGRTRLKPRTAGEKGARYLLEFDSADEGPLLIRVAMSSTSCAAALRNLEAEMPTFDFEAVRSAAQASWDDFLGRFEIVRGTDAQKTTFYTALYHLGISPNNIADVGTPARYSTFSFWDTFRAAHPLYTLICPERITGFVDSIMADYRKNGFLPVWTLWGEDNQCMIGTHSVPVLADAFLKGFAYDWEEVYAAVRDTLRSSHPNRRKEGWNLIDAYGYYPIDKVKGEGVSRLLECAYDDWCAARMAEKIGGREDDVKFFERRARNYLNVFDPTIGLVRGKDSNGRWRDPFDPLRLGHGAGSDNDFTEGNAWQYTWHVMHDPEGLIALFGGKEPFAARLHSLFTMPSEACGTDRVLDVTGLIGQYAHGNEPSHHAIYFFQHAGRPDLTAKYVREVCDRFYLNKPDGLCGNDDCGQMSAWYAFSAMGFYPFNPCGGEYVLGAPQIPEVKLRLANGKTFTVVAKELSEANKYVKSVTFRPCDGSPSRSLGFILKHADILDGGTLEFQMTDGKDNVEAADAMRDLIVVGGTSAAVEAAVRARSSGRDVLLLAPRSYLGEDVAGTMSGVTADTTPLEIKRGLDRRLLTDKVDFRTWSPVVDILSNGVRVVTRGGMRTYQSKEVVDCRSWRVNPNAAFAGRGIRIVRFVVSGERPDVGRGGTVESVCELGERGIELCPEGFPSVVTARLWRCEFDVSLPENTVRGRLAAEQEARDRTWTSLQLDAADVCLSDRDRGMLPCGEIDCDVLVAGAGTGGAPAAIAAARSGARTIVCEWTYHMGGLTTDGMIAKYWFGNRCGFTTEIDQGHVQLGACFNQTKDEWFRREARKAGVEILFGTLVSDVIVESGRVTGAWIVLPTGERVRVKCKCVIDATGNADLAAAAGEVTEFITGDELALQGAAFMLKDLGRSYMNADFTFIDDTDAEDLFYASLRGRCSYGRGWDQSQVIDTRERRRIHGVHYVTPQDVMNGRTYPDVICITKSNFDTHGQTIDPQFFMMDPPHDPPLQVYLPYRAILPQRTDGLLVIGLGMSAHRDAMPILRMQPDVQNQGYAAGLAAAMAVRCGRTVRSIDVKELQRKLIEKGVLPKDVLTMEDSYPISEDRLSAAVSSLESGYEGLGLVMADPSRSLPLLRTAYLKQPSLRIAHVLAMMGDRAGGGMLCDAVRGMMWDRGWNYRGMRQFKRSVSLLDSYIIAIGRSLPAGGDAIVREKARLLVAGSDYSHFRAVALALESYGGGENAACLSRLLRMPGVGGHAFAWERNGAPAIQKWNVYPKDVQREGMAVPDRERSDCLKELCLARALYRCGDAKDCLGERTLKAYAQDPRKAYANHAKKVLEASDE